MKKYEAIVIFPSTAKDDVLEKSMERLRGEIAKLNGTIQDVQVIGMRTFARPMKKKDAGNYTKINFSMEQENVNQLRDRLKLNEGIFRVQIVCSDTRQKKVAPVAAPVTAPVAQQ